MIVNFKDRRPGALGNFDLDFIQAISFFNDKGLAQTWNWSDMLKDEHNAAFTVAKMMNDDLLLAVKDGLSKALTEGKTLADFKDELIPLLQKKGWWGKQVINPGTAFEQTVQLGSASRLENIFRTNMQSAYAVGHWQAIDDAKLAMPYLMYDAVDDSRTRPEHAKHDNVVLPVTDKFWNTHYPPNGWQCRCGVIQMSKEDLADYGLSVSPAQKPAMKKWKKPGSDKVNLVPEGVDPGFDHNAGKTRLEHLNKVQADKLAKAQKEAALIKKGNEKARQAAKEANQALKELGISSTQGLANKALDKAKERAAQFEIDHAIEANTPYLAAAIKKVANTKAAQSMNAQELLAKAKQQADTKKLGDQLAKFKKAKIANKEPGTNAKAAFDSLPEEAQQAIIAEIDVKTGNAQAKEELTKIAAGEAQKQAAFKKQIFDKMTKDGSAANYPDAKSLVAAIEEQAKVKQQAKEKSKHLSGYKKKLIEGKIPTPKQKEVFDSLDELEKMKVTADITKAQAELVPPADAVQALKDALADVTKPEKVSEPTLSMANMVKYATKKKGSNDGAFYQDTETGKRYYIKTLASEDIARNETLASRLYELAGTEAPRYYYFSENGKFHVASEIIEGLEESRHKLVNNLADNVHENMVVDAWLANWDVIGLDYDNLILLNNRAIRMDPGGALRYRAQGGLKGDRFGNDVTELETFLDSSLNPQAASVFSNATREQLIIGARKVLRITDEQIDDMVDRFGSRDPNIANELKAKLKARRDYIAKAFPEALPQKPKPDIIETVTDADLLAIKESRVNGYSLTIDEDFIQDHNVKLSHFIDENGEPATMLTMKLTEKGLGEVSKQFNDNSGSISLTSLKEKVSTVARGIGALYRDKKVIRTLDIDRLNAAIDEVNSVIDKAKNKAVYTDQQMVTLLSWRDELQRMKGIAKLNLPAQPWAFMMKTDDLPNVFDLVSDKAAAGLSWEKAGTFRYKAMQYDRSTPRQQGHTISAPYTTNYKAKPGDDVKINVMAGDAYYSRGYVQIEVKGNNKAAAARAIEQIEALGVPNQLTTKAVRTELYLDQTAYRRWALLDRNMTAKYQALNDITDPEARRLAKLDFINNAVGYDITKNPLWNKRDTGQAWEHGRRVFYRTDLESPEYDQWADNHVLFHAIGTLGKDGASFSINEKLKDVFNGGGMLASLGERLRRGLPESAQALSTDYSKGGANYVFTRIKSRSSSSYNGLNAVGLYFKPHKLMKRMDRISYDDDEFGSQLDSTLASRGEHISDWVANAKRPRDETIFKDGLSLFEDLEKIVLYSESDRQEFIAWLKSNNYEKWPDGRDLEEVIQARY
ncbi:hypothetical protein tloyanaT_13300 [Thalassotalea loyana]|uniref:Phage head morphogenesis domain-containing protein n=1 Tax=Thalassotalea loyana TaxID=280483 RepID=A0ABQ6HAC6_9GAMM|nr:phage minor head protein [Thalassotalea loyana]GLX85078.1 hypothetical protein tloyanaT_13300 [Thalassotalea loyana]